MQISAGPDLPHTRARSVHWIVTAVALAAVVGTAPLVRPAGTAPKETDRLRDAPAAAPDPAAADYPMECADAPVEVVNSVSSDLDRDGRPETVVVVRCRTGGGTPPSGVYVLSSAGAPGTAPRVAETLVDPKERRSVLDFRLDGQVVRATVLGYSDDSVPRCCPDQQRPYSWHWRGGEYYRTAAPLPGSV